ncbi:hypothetical protein WJX72_005981 [[Myrmecia] bisecta]|uniref:Kinesin motor domain-containing protein n=1 Tax=[Myrmecia] bisecta TaxID=41462 RepID=A0AAW1Q7H6_9CHLO
MESTQPKGPTRLPLHLANVKVAVRLRPRALGAQGSHATVPDLVHCQFGRLKLDCVLDERANNEAVFQATVRQMAEDLLRGNSSTLLLLGAPASGKSYTLEGLEEPDCHQAGLIVQTVAHLLQSSTGTGTLTAGYTALTAGPRPVLVDLLAPGSAPHASQGQPDEERQAFTLTFVELRYDMAQRLQTGSEARKQMQHADAPAAPSVWRIESVVKAQRHLITSSPQSSAALRQLRLVEKESGMLRRQVLDLLHILQVQIIDLHREAAHIRAFTLAEADKAAVQSSLGGSKRVSKEDLAAAHEQQSTTSTDLRGQLAVLQARLSDNEAGQAAKDKALEELQQQHAAGQAEVARLHADADRLRFEIGEVLTKADAETTALMGKLGACQQDNAQLHTQLQAAADSLEAAEHSMLTAVQQAEARFQQRCTEAAAAQQALLLDIGQLRQAQQAGQERQTDLERQLSAAKKREGLLVAELQGLRQQAGLLEKQRMAEVTQLSTAAADAAHFEKEACALRNQVGELQSQLKKLQRKLAQATQPGESPPQAPPQVDRSPWGANQRPEEHSDQPTPAVRPVSVQHTEGHYAQHALGKLGLDNDDLYDLNRRLFHTWTDARSELSVTKHQLMDCQVQSVLKDCNHSTSCRCHSADVTKSDQQHHHVGLFPKTPTKFDSLSTRLALRRAVGES